uniref:Uncharacterized protein n=1 Tax=Arundo donax TaxID=35708 RepID=A0A0A9BGQ2_ARUDO
MLPWRRRQKDHQVRRNHQGLHQQHEDLVPQGESGRWRRETRAGAAAASAAARGQGAAAAGQGRRVLVLVLQDRPGAASGGARRRGEARALRQVLLPAG